MTFRIVRVKRRPDQDPVEALYLPTSDQKRSKTENDYRLFKFVNKTEEPRQFRKGADGAKVVLLSDVNESANVVDAVLLDTGDALPKRKFSIENEMSEMTLSAATNSDYVYDMYRIDLGRYSEADIKANMVGIVSYEQELVNENECADSDVYENEDDSNAEDYYANDYPDEESWGSNESGFSDFVDSNFEAAIFQDRADEEYLEYLDASDYYSDGVYEDEFRLDHKTDEFDYFSSEDDL